MRSLPVLPNLCNLRRARGPALRSTPPCTASFCACARHAARQHYPNTIKTNVNSATNIRGAREWQRVPTQGSPPRKMRREQARRRERARKTRGRRAVLHLRALPSTPRNAPPWTHAPWNEGWRALPRDRRARSRGMVDRRTPPGLPGSSVCSRGGGARPHPNQPSCAQTAPQRSPPHVHGVVASLPRRGGGTETPRRLHGGSRAIPSALHMP